MQVSKVAVVATGALATAAAMGSTPAFAADSEGTPAVAPATVGVLDYEGRHRASDEAMRELAEYWLTVAPEQSWSAPWEQDPPQILSLASGSALSLIPIQQCGSTGPMVLGISVPIASPATVMGDCKNGNIDIKRGGGDALLSLLDGTAISVAPIQQCGSSNGVLGIGVPIASPSTVGGDCKNGNITIGHDDDDWDRDEPDHRGHDRKQQHPNPRYDYYYHQTDRSSVAATGAPTRPTAQAAQPVTMATPAGTPAPLAGAQSQLAATPGQAAGPSAPLTTAQQQLTASSAQAAEAVAQAAADEAAREAADAAAQAAVQAPAAEAAGREESGLAQPGGWDNGGWDNGGQDGGWDNGGRDNDGRDDGPSIDADVAPWEADPPQILSLLGGSAVSALAIQQCGSTGPMVLGISVPIASPATVMGDCKNGNIDINEKPSDALLSLLDRTALSVAPIQQCGSSNGVLTIGVPIASPSTVGGDCKNGNISIG